MEHPNQQNAQTPTPIPAAGAPQSVQAQPAEWKEKAKSVGSIILDGGKAHVATPLVHGFFYTVGAGLAYMGGKKLNLL